MNAASCAESTHIISTGNCKDGANGFTLVELLVVISIIAILISLLLPALENAKQVALAFDCGNNQRQIGLAMVEYTTENGVFPQFTYHSGNGWSTVLGQDAGQWDDTIFLGGKDPETVAGCSNPAKATVSPIPILKCPCEPLDGVWSSGAYPEFQESYEPNGWMTEGNYPIFSYVGESYDLRGYSNTITQPHWANANMLDDPSGKIMVGEIWRNFNLIGRGAAISDPKLLYAPFHPTNIPFPSSPDPAEIVAPSTQHGNYLFFDGHVEYMSVATVMTSILVANDTRQYYIYWESAAEGGYVN